MSHLLLGYIGPETIVPFLSAIAAVGGAIMMAGKSTVAAVKNAVLGLIPGYANRVTTVAEESSDTPQ